MRIPLTGACLIALLGGSQLTPAPALADEEQLHNVTYRARVDGLARGAQVTYTAQDNRLQTADPTMLPGRTFEANTVLNDDEQARLRVSIEPPYTANLHCQILVDGGVVAQADEFIAPRLTRPSGDPDYGTLTCQAQVSPAAGGPPAADQPVGAQPAANPSAG